MAAGVTREIRLDANKICSVGRGRRAATSRRWLSKGSAAESASSGVAVGTTVWRMKRAAELSAGLVWWASCDNRD